MRSYDSLFDAEILEPSTDVAKEDFCRYLVQSNAYIFIPCREIWPGSSVDIRVPPIPVLDEDGRPVLKKGKPVEMPASKWIDANCRVEQITWHPGLPMFVHDRLAVAGGWVEKQGTASFNQYRAPNIVLGDASKATLWLAHGKRIYPNDFDYIQRWLAWHRQHPGDKVNCALVLAGVPGIGKDTLLQPVKLAVGPWNFQEISPKHLTGNFNSHAKAVIMRISEAHDLGDMDRFKFFETIKVYTASPPDTLRINEKHIREYYIHNCVGVIITTNYKTDAYTYRQTTAGTLLHGLTVKKRILKTNTGSGCGVFMKTKVVMDTLLLTWIH